MELSTYEEALSYIHSARYTGKKTGLINITNLMDKLDNVHETLAYVHIAGTNGKGSTGAYISNVLRVSGYKTGYFSSPYIEDFCERIRINNELIPREKLIRITSTVRTAVEEIIAEGLENPSEFEIVTAIGLLFFCEEKCDIVVLETGVGGRLDSTNIIKDAKCAVITAIGYDHMDYLGDTIKKIAAEKAGIIKQNYDVIVYDSGEEVLNVFKEKCEETISALHLVDFNKISNVKAVGTNQEFAYKDYEYMTIYLRGFHQIKNACVAIEACEVLKNKGYDISIEDIKTGLKETQWPCRLEKIDTDAEVYIDGAHNTHGVNALQEFVCGLNEEDKNKKIIFIVGILKSKKFEEMIEALSKTAAGFIFPEFLNEHAVDNDELLKVALKYCKNSKKSGNIKQVLQKLSNSKEFIYIFCGSLYFAGEVRKEYANEFKARNCSISEA